MHQFPIGVLLTSFHEEEKAAVRNAKTCGAAGMQVPVVRGELAGDALVGGAINHIVSCILEGVPCQARLRMASS